MNNLWGEESDIINNKKKNSMKLIFASNSEKSRITNLVMNASSISNSRSLMDLVRDAEVDGSEKEPEAPKKKEPDVPTQEPMAKLIERAEAMGVRVSREDSRAGILLKIKEFEAPKANKEEPKVPVEAPKVEEKPADTNKVVSAKKYKVLVEGGIQLSGSDSTIETGAEYEAEPESDETLQLLELGAIEEII